MDPKFPAISKISESAFAESLDFFNSSKCVSISAKFCAMLRGSA
jgi:hypothetical protein